MLFVLTNEKGLFAEVDFRGVITHDGLAHLKRERAGMTAQDAALFDKALPLLERLPTGEALFFFGPNDSTLPVTQTSAHYPQGWGNVSARGWYVPGSFQGKSPSRNLAPSNRDEDLGWTVAEDLLRLKAPLEDLMTRHGLTVGHTAFQGMATLKKRRGSWTLTERNDTMALSEARACVLFVPHRDNGGGYLNDKGTTVPLAGARLFESAEAAKRTRNSRGLSDAVVVEVETRIVRLAPGETPPHGSALTGALAKLEAQELDASLPAVEDTPTARARARRM